jgi:hypothetical protein
MLEVEQFDLLGSEGSGTIGCPSNIEEELCLRDIDRRLSTLMNQSEWDRQGSMISHTRTRTNHSDTFQSLPTSSGTQPEFSTQLFEHAPKVQPVLRQADAPLAGKGASLLAVLSGFVKGKSIEPISIPTVRLSNGSQVVQLEKDGNTSREACALQTVSNRKVMLPPPQLENGTNVQLCSSPISSRSSQLSAEPLSAKNFNSHNSQLHVPNNDLYEKKASQDRAKRTCPDTYAGPGGETGIYNAGHHTEVTPASFVELAKDSNLFEDLKRIPRSYVRVPESQRTMLERKDSWAHSQTDGYPACLNVPSEVIQDLMMFLEKRHFAGCEEGSQSESDHAKSVEKATHYPMMDGTDEQRIGLESDCRNPDGGSNFDLEREPTCDTSKLFELSHQSSLAVSFGYANENIDMGDKMSDDEQISWPATPDESSTPERRLRTPSNYEILPRVHSAKDNSQKADNPELNAGYSLSPIFYPNNCQQLSKTLEHQPIHQKVCNYAFPASSLDVDGELELDVLHAIGDEVNDCDSDIIDAPEASQDLPSTANHDFVVQVEQTPFHNQRSLGWEIVYGSPSRQPLPPFLEQGKMEHNMSSDPIIPATFDDTKPSVVMNTITVQETRLSNMGGQEDDIPLADNEHNTGKYDDLAENQIFEDLRCSQHVNKRNVAHLDEVAGSSSSKATKTINDVSSLSVTSEEAFIDYVPTPAPETRIIEEYRHVDVSARHVAINEECASKHGISSISEDTRTPSVKRRRLVKPTTLGLSQDEHAAVDITQMVRANRQNFRNLVDDTKRAISDTRPKSNTLEGDKMTDCSTTVGSLFSITEPAKLNYASVTSISQFQDLNFQFESTPSRMRSKDIKSITTNRQDNSRYYLHCAPSRAFENSGHSTDLMILSTAFQKFQSTYPTYMGNEKQFTQAICYIDWLGSKKKRRPDQSLWDDMIQTLSAEYLEYVSEARRTGTNKKDILTGVDFFCYRNEARIPSFIERIITDTTIKQAISISDPSSVENAMSLLNGSEVATTEKESVSRMDAPSIVMPSMPSNSGVQEPSRSCQKPAATSNIGITASKHLYFETHSQMRVAQGLLFKGFESGSGLQTPRPGSKTSRTSIIQQSPPVKNGHATSPFTPIARSPTTTPQATKIVSPASLSGSHGSPILGTGHRTSIKSIPRATNRARSSPYSSSRRTPKSTRLSVPKSVFRRTKSLPHRSNSNPRKVEEWLADQNTASIGRGQNEFNAFVRLQKEKGVFLRPLTPKTNFCTKRVGHSTITHSPGRVV